MATTDDGDVTRVTEALGGLVPGTVLAGRYVLERSLGEGAMGRVFAAVDAELEERVAIKLLQPLAQQEPSARERFRREVRLAHRVTHRNVARTFDIGEADGQVFLTMQLVEGESLQALLEREGALPARRVAAIGIEICEGLAAAHEAGVLHRDLKPANIMIERDTGRVILTDFGIAREVLDSGAITLDGDELVGTPVYMAPEQVRGETLDVRTDLFALGVILYELVTGRRPFGGSSPAEIAQARLLRSAESPGRHVSLPTALEQLVMQCLAREPSQRPDDARTVASRLAALSSSDGEALTTSASSADTEGGPSSTGAGFVPVEPGKQAIAVLPLHYRGPADDAYLAEALTEQLIDLLAMTEGLKVLGAGAVRRCGDERDPVEIRRILGVDGVIDGTVQRAGSRIRVTVRLLDARTGRQTWSEQLDGELSDVFALQDRCATRVAETLRLRLETCAHGYRASSEVVSLYFRARRKMGELLLGGEGPEGAVALLERCVELAPEFAPARAMLALACARMEFFHGAKPGDRDWPSLSEATVAAALARAPGIPETHLASARMHAQRGNLPRAARDLQRALSLAPTHAEARAYLGFLQCEAGLPVEGLRHIDLAVELEPGTHWPLLMKLRYLGLRGDLEGVGQLVEQLEVEAPDLSFGLAMVRLRVAIWHGQEEVIRCCRAHLEQIGHPRAEFGRAASAYVLGEIDAAELAAVCERCRGLGTSRRYLALIEQEMAEVYMARGRREDALRHLESLAEADFVDVDWLEHCPILAPIRDEPRMRMMMRTVRARAQGLWSVG